MALLTVQDMSGTGLSASFTTCDSSGNTFVNDGHTMIHIKSASTATNLLRIGIDSQRIPVWDGLGTAEIRVSIPVTGDVWLGFLDRKAYNSTAHIVSINYTTDSTLLYFERTYWASDTSWASETSWYGGRSNLSIAVLSVT
jgi:hypothetical protein